MLYFVTLIPGFDLIMGSYDSEVPCTGPCVKQGGDDGAPLFFLGQLLLFLGFNYATAPVAAWIAATFPVSDWPTLDLGHCSEHLDLE